MNIQLLNERKLYITNRTSHPLGFYVSPICKCCIYTIVYLPPSSSTSSVFPWGLRFDLWSNIEITYNIPGTPPPATKRQIIKSVSAELCTSPSPTPVSLFCLGCCRFLTAGVTGQPSTEGQHRLNITERCVPELVYLCMKWAHWTQVWLTFDCRCGVRLKEKSPLVALRATV